MGAYAPIFAASWTPIYEGPFLGSRTAPALPLPSALVQNLPQEQHTGPPSVPFEWNRRGKDDQAKLSFAP